MRFRLVQLLVVLVLFSGTLGCRSVGKMFASNGESKWWHIRKGKASETELATAPPAYPQLPSAAAQAATTTAPPAVAPGAPDPVAAYVAQTGGAPQIVPPSGYPAAGAQYDPAAAAAAPQAGGYNTDYYAQAAAPAAAADPYAAGGYAPQPGYAQQAYPAQPAPGAPYDPNQGWQQQAPVNPYAQPPTANYATPPQGDPNYYAQPAADPYAGQPAYQVAANPYPAPQYRSQDPQYGANNAGPVGAAPTQWASENQPPSGVATNVPNSNGQWSQQPVYSADQTQYAPAPTAYVPQQPAPTVAPQPYRPGGTGNYVPTPRTSSTDAAASGVSPAVYQAAPGAPGAALPTSAAAGPPAVYLPPAEASGSSW